MLERAEGHGKQDAEIADVDSPVEDKLAIVVARIDDQFPLTKDFYESLVNSRTIQVMVCVDELGMNENTDALKSVFGLEKLKDKHTFVFKDKSLDDETEDEESGETQTASADGA